MSVVIDNIPGEKEKEKEKEKETSVKMLHAIHKVPPGDGPYVRAKYAQLVEKDLEGAIVWFWKAINGGDRVDSALKDMALVMKQLHRTEEAIEAIKSFRHLCSQKAQASLDNVLMHFYKKSGKVDQQIALLKRKLRMIYEGEAFNGKPTKTARSRGKKLQVSVKQETSKLLGNLGWAYMQKNQYMAAEVVYKKAQMIDPDGNKACNLAISLMKQARCDEARSVLQDVLHGKFPASEPTRPRDRAQELLLDLESRLPPPSSSLSSSSSSLSSSSSSLSSSSSSSSSSLSSSSSSLSSSSSSSDLMGLNSDDESVDGLEWLFQAWGPLRSKRLPIFEQISSFRDQMACR